MVRAMEQGQWAKEVRLMPSGYGRGGGGSPYETQQTAAGIGGDVTFAMNGAGRLSGRGEADQLEPPQRIELEAPLFTSVDDVTARLAETGYLASPAVATTVFLAARLGKPLLVEGPAGVGKTELAKAVAAISDARLIRLQCYEGVDEARALYEWNHAKQLLRITAGRDESWDQTRTDIFGEEFLLSRPLLAAIRGDDAKVLLIDEIDKADVEVEGLLLEVLSDFQVTVPELGTITATRRPFTVLTSNASRELSEALRRRCLFLHIGFPEEELERRIVALKVPELDRVLAESLVRVVGALRAMDLRKAPSVAETVDWARTLLALGADRLDDEVVRQSLGVVLKHQEDVRTATAKLELDAV
jgi:MoxR-like ATPase